MFKDELYKPGSGVIVKVSDEIKTCDDWMDDFIFYGDDFPASIVISGIKQIHFTDVLTYLLVSSSLFLSLFVYFLTLYCSGSLISCI